MFAAYFDLNGTSAVKEAAIQIDDVDYLNPISRKEIWNDSRALLLQQNFLEESQAGIYKCSKTGLRMVSWSTIYNKAELKSKLDHDLLMESSSDESFIIASYLKWGEDCCEHLVGDFSFLIYKQNNGDIFFARDQIGARPLYYYQDSGSIIVASSVELIKNFSQVDKQLNEEWLARFIVDRSQDWVQTAFKKIKKVQPANFFSCNLNEKKLSKKCYFEFQIESSLRLKSDDEYVEAYKEKLNQAVNCRLKGDKIIGSELSGGLDSSTVTALVSKNIQSPGKFLHTFGSAESAMAMDCVYELTQYVPMSLFHFLTDRNQNGIDQYAENQCYGMPIDNGTASATSVFYAECQRLGITSLFSGFGGDEFVTSEAPVALVEFWNDKNFLLFLSRQRGNWFAKPLHTLRWLYLFYKHKNKSITSRRLAAAGELDWSINPLEESVIKNYDIKSKYFAALKYDGEKRTQNEFALQDRLSPYLVARLETSSLIAAHYGVEYKWPLLDVRLLKFFLSVPASQKLGPKLTGRYLHRRAVVDLLPKRLSTKSKDMVSLNPIYRIYSALISNAHLMFEMKRLAKQNSNIKPKEQSSQTSQVGRNVEIGEELELILSKTKTAALIKKVKNGSEYEKKFAERQLARLNRLSQWIATNKKCEH